MKLPIAKVHEKGTAMQGKLRRQGQSKAELNQGRNEGENEKSERKRAKESGYSLQETGRWTDSQADRHGRDDRMAMSKQPDQLIMMGSCPKVYLDAVQ